MRNKYTMIACVNNKRAIGAGGRLLYHIKSDMENFKLMTETNVVIMGRRAFEGLPGRKPLPNRVNIVVTTRENYPDWEIPESDVDLFKDTYFVSSLEEADDFCYSYFPDRRLFIVGGGETFNRAFELDMVEEAIIALVNDDTEGDVYFPDIMNDDRYKLVFKTMSIRDHPNDLYYRYVVYQRKTVPVRSQFVVSK